MLKNHVMKLKFVMMTVWVTFKILPNRSSCFAHTLQLVVRGGLNECGSQ